MVAITWDVRRFQELTVDQLFQTMQLRVNVFVVEQACAYPELDAYDRHVEVRHLLGCDACGQVLAYARILPAGLCYPEVGLGRLVVSAQARGCGMGHQLVQRALYEIATCWPGSMVKIAAQVYLQGFYEQHGFTPVSDPYLEDGISHMDMLKSC
ncbi:MAG: GNAT family N-acetyltransferase [Nitrospirales bacterium]|nr:GNAT family N-acetyltransferase [Nitrospirales bacterium]